MEEEITKLKQDIEKAKGARIRAEARLEELNRQKQDILNQLTILGVSPENLDDEIKKLDQEITDKISQVKQMLPEV